MQFIQGHLRFVRTYLILTISLLWYSLNHCADERILARIKQHPQHPHMTAACLFPRARGDKDNVVEAILKRYSEIVYTKDFELKLYGPRNFLSLIYDGEEWIEVNAYLSSKVDNCFNVLLGTWPMRVYFIKMHDCNKTVECKWTIRDLFDLETHSIHMTDTQFETERLARQILMPGGIDRLNNSIPIR